MAAKAVNFLLEDPSESEHILFDGRHWECLSEAELKPNTAHPQFKLVTAALQRQQPTLTVRSCIDKLLMSRGARASEGLQLANWLTPHVVAHLNGFDAGPIFCTDMKAALEMGECLVDKKTEQEQDLFLDLQEALQDAATACSRFKGLLTPHVAMPEHSPFLEHVIEAYQDAAAAYFKRQQYRDQEAKLQSRRGAARNFSKEGAALLKQQDHVGASAKFIQCLNEATHYCTKSDGELAVAYYNLGRCCELRGHFAQAAFFLDICHTLRTHYDTSDDVAGLKKAEEALSRVHQKLKQPCLE